MASSRKFIVRTTALGTLVVAVLVVDGHWPQHLCALRQVEQVQHVVERAEVAGDGGKPGRGREVRL